MCDVAFLAQAEVRLSITIVFCHCASSAMSLFRDENGWRIYGPVETELTHPWLQRKQIDTVRKKFHTTPYLKGWVGGWLHVHDTMQGMLWLSDEVYAVRSKYTVCIQRDPSAADEV